MINSFRLLTGQIGTSRQFRISILIIDTCPGDPFEATLDALLRLARDHRNLQFGTRRFLVWKSEKCRVLIERPWFGWGRGLTELDVLAEAELQAEAIARASGVRLGGVPSVSNLSLTPRKTGSA